MTDTLTSERSIEQFRGVAAKRFNVLRYGTEKRSESSFSVHDWLPTPPQTPQPRLFRYEQQQQSLVNYVIVLGADEVSLQTSPWVAYQPEDREFAGLAAYLATGHEFSSMCSDYTRLISNDEWALPAASDGLLKYLTEVFSASSGVPWALRYWADRVAELASDVLPASVNEPRMTFDPENENDWWVAITATCHGGVDLVLEAYGELVERFVAEIPVEARNRIKIELEIEG